MQELQKYRFQKDNPLTEPYTKDGVFNAYYHGFDVQKNRNVLISEYSEQKYQRLILKQKRLLKLKDIRHKNIVEIYDIIVDKENKKMFVIMEWCQGGSLYDYQKSNSTTDCDFAVKILEGIALGLRQIHSRQEIFRHINMENIQFDSKGTPKLSFRCLYPKMYYMSIQEIQGNRTKQNDLFSLGVLFYKILMGQTLFKGNNKDQQIKTILDGPKFPKQDQKMFPISLPIQIKDLVVKMTMPKAQDRWNASLIVQNCQKYLNNINKNFKQVTDLPKNLLSLLFTKDIISVYIRAASPDEYLVVGLNCKKHQLMKTHIFKSKQKKVLSQYQQKVLKPYRQVNDEIEIVPIFENFIEGQYLVIRTFYDNQGSLKFYLDRSGSIQPQHAKIFIDKLVEKLKKYGKTHNHLTSDNILLKNGNFYINYPPPMTKQKLNSLKNSKNEVDFIAPEVKDGKNSQNGDSWSVAALKYMLQNKEMPKFDKNGNLVLNKANKSQKDINFYENGLVKDPEKRKKLDAIDKQPQPQPQLEPQPQSQPQQEQQIKPRPPSPPPKKKKQETPRKPISKPKILPPLPPAPPVSRKTFGQLFYEKFQVIQPLEKHWTKPIRVGIKCGIGLIFLIFIYYWNFFLVNGRLITQRSIYQSKSISIRGFENDAVPQIKYNLVTKTPSDTEKLFYNKTLNVLRDEYKCVLNDFSVQSDVVQVLNSSSFTAYQIFGILFTIINLIIFCLSLSKMDFPKVFFISKLEENNFNQIWNWVFVNMALATQISFIYLTYGSLFHMTLEPCLQKPTLTAVQFLFKKWNFSFNIRYIWIYLGLVFSYMVVIFFIIKPHYTVHRILKLVLVGLYLAGTFSRIMGGSGGHVAWQKQSVFGKVGELFLLIMSVMYLILDMVFGCCIKSHQKPYKKNQVNEDSVADMNPTEQNFLPQ